MESKRYYIYRGYDKRIIGIKEYTHWYVPIREFDYIIYDGHIKNETFNDMHNYGWNVRDDEYVIIFRQQYSNEILKKCQEDAIALDLWEKFENFILRYTRFYAKSSFDTMYDLYIMDEINIYKSNINIGPLIKSLLDLNSNDYSINDIIEKELVRIEDKKNIVSFINTQRHNLKNLIAEKKYDEALNYIKKNHRSW
tara:strand:+ start:4434 stop:5021 length:588 start_codon:yes stop_codon:yes gene_type:complete